MEHLMVAGARLRLGRMRVDRSTKAIEDAAVCLVRADIGGIAPEGLMAFFRASFTVPYGVRSLTELARRLRINRSTLSARFWRLDLPSPRRYLAHARLVRAFALLDDPRLSCTEVACLMDESSPQSWFRMVRTLTGQHASTLREQYSGRRMLDRYRRELIQPYASTLLKFDPLRGTPWVRYVDAKMEGC